MKLLHSSTSIKRKVKTSSIATAASTVAAVLALGFLLSARGEPGKASTGSSGASSTGGGVFAPTPAPMGGSSAPEQ